MLQNVGSIDDYGQEAAADLTTELSCILYYRGGPFRLPSESQVGVSRRRGLLLDHNRDTWIQPPCLPIVAFHEVYQSLQRA